MGEEKDQIGKDKLWLQQAAKLSHEEHESAPQWLGADSAGHLPTSRPPPALWRAGQVTPSQQWGDRHYEKATFQLPLVLITDTVAMKE